MGLKGTQLLVYADDNLLGENIMVHMLWYLSISQKL
jgi:hypothetical protein